MGKSGDIELIKYTLSSFSCIHNPDIESFLHYRAIDFELLSKARTYLIIDSEQSSTNHLLIQGYFSLTLKTLTIPKDLSNRTRKELDGFSGKSQGKPIKNIPCYLIGQLAKNSNICPNTISGNKILEFASAAIIAAVNLVGGRYMMIECQDNTKLIDFYRANCFYEITRRVDGDTIMLQMIRKI